jgi:hypothetical protein
VGRRRCGESRAACWGHDEQFDLGASRRPSLRRSSLSCPRAGRRSPNTDGCAVYGAGRRRTGHEGGDVDSGAPLPLKQRGGRAFIDDIEHKLTAAVLVHVLSMRPQVPGTTEVLRTLSGGGAGRSLTVESSGPSPLRNRTITPAVSNVSAPASALSRSLKTLTPSGPNQLPTTPRG